MRDAVALLITLFLVLLMSIAVGVGLKSANKAKESVQKEAFMIQSGILVEDVLNMLKGSPELHQITESNSSTALYAFLSSASAIPFQSGDVRVLVTLQSARGHFNINALKDANATKAEEKASRLEALFLRHELSSDLVNYLEDAMGGFKEDGSYKSDLFLLRPELFRDYIASAHHLEKILLVYGQKTHINPYSKLNFDTLFSFEKESATKIDLNYATPEVWELLIGASRERARKLSENAGSYETLGDLGLDEKEKEMLGVFDYSFFEPVVAVHMDMAQGNIHGSIEFEFDLRTQKAGNFVYEI